MFRRVLFTESHPTALLVHSLLREAGYHPAPVPDADHVFLAGADRGYYIEVPDEEVAEAVKFLKGQGYQADILQPRQ